MKNIKNFFHSLPLSKKMFLIFFICMPILIFLYLVCFYSVSVHKEFIPALKVVKKSLLQKVIRENYQNTGVQLEPQKIKVLQVSGKGWKKLYIFDFNTHQLCGTAGCLYSAYTNKGERVLNIYLHPYLPKPKTLLAVDKQKTSDGFPCLVLSQIQDDKTLSLNQYCYLSSSKAFVQFNQYSESILKSQ